MMNAPARSPANGRACLMRGSRFSRTISKVCLTSWSVTCGGKLVFPAFVSTRNCMAMPPVTGPSRPLKPSLLRSIERRRRCGRSRDRAGTEGKRDGVRWRHPFAIGPGLLERTWSKPGLGRRSRGIEVGLLIRRPRRPHPLHHRRGRPEKFCRTREVRLRRRDTRERAQLVRNHPLVAPPIRELEGLQRQLRRALEVPELPLHDAQVAGFPRDRRELAKLARQLHALAHEPTCDFQVSSHLGGHAEHMKRVRPTDLVISSAHALKGLIAQASGSIEIALPQLHPCHPT